MADHKNSQLKFVILGDGTTGKTSIASRISQNNFTKNYDQTLGVDFFPLKGMELPGDVQVDIQVWDIGGQTVGGKMLDNYVYNAHAVLFVYDITNYASFENLEDWLKEVNRICAKSSPHLALVANKIDMEHMRTVRKDRHKEFAQTHNMSSHGVSAKTDDMVYQCFLKVAAAVMRIRLMTSDLERSQTVVIAEVVPHERPKRIGGSDTTQKVVREKRTRSAFCALQ